MKLQAALVSTCLLATAHSQLPNDTPLPDVTAYNEQGEPFNLRENLTGHHSVIVFGCLT